MQKFDLAGTAANKEHLVDVPLGREVVLALSGTPASAVLTVEYATAPGVFVGYTSAVTISAASQTTVRNVGAHTELKVTCASATGSTDLVLIANVVPL